MGSITTWEPASPRQPVVWSTRSEAGADGESPDGRGRRPRPTARPRRRLGVRSPTSRAASRETERHQVVADAELMRRALALGDTARRRTAAQPLGRVRWSCATARSSARARPSRPGGAHAEIEALRAAGDRARGATVYTTLEPCSHHGRTAPVRRRARSRPASPGSSSRSRTPTRRSRARASRGCATAASPSTSASAPTPPRRRSRPYLLHRRLGRAFAVVKTAMSLDGRIAAARRLVAVDHRRRGPGRRPRAARRLAGRGRRRRHRARRPSEPHRPRRRRPRCEHQPLRVLLDATGRVPADGPLFDADARADPRRHHRRRARRRAATRGSPRAPRCSPSRPRPPAPASTSPPRSRCSAGSGCSRRWSKAAPRSRGSLLEAGLVDRLVTYVAPHDARARRPPALDLAGPDRIADAPRWRLVDVARVGDRRPPRLRARAAPRGAAADVHRHRRGARHRARGHPERRRRAHRDRRHARCSTTPSSARRSRSTAAASPWSSSATDGWAADAVTETLDRTTSARSRAGDPVNLERPVRLADRLGGHLVQGHVDARRHRRATATPLPDGSTRMTVRRARPTLAALRRREGLDHRRRHQPHRRRRSTTTGSTSRSSRTPSPSPPWVPGSRVIPSTWRSTCSPSTSSASSTHVSE